MVSNKGFLCVCVCFLLVKDFQNPSLPVLKLLFDHLKDIIPCHNSEINFRKTKTIFYSLVCYTIQTATVTK